MSDNWRSVADNIMDLVQDAVDNKEFSNLSADIREVVSSIKSAATSGMEDAKKATSNGYYQQVYHGVDDIDETDETDENDTHKAPNYSNTRNYNNYSNPNIAYNNGTVINKIDNTIYDSRFFPGTVINKKNLPGKVWAPICTVIGSVVLFADLLVALFTGMIDSIIGAAGGSSIASSIFTAGSIVVIVILFLIGFPLFNCGLKRININKKFVMYSDVIDGRNYYDISKMADNLGMKKNKVIRELKQLVKLRYFRQGHLDDNNTTFILTDKIYNDYLENNRRRQEYERNNVQVEKSEQKSDADIQQDMTKSQAETLYEEGKQYVEYIQKCNALVKDEEMKKKLSVLEDLISRIFDKLNKEPEKKDDMYKFMKYYLPTTKKLLESYNEFDSQPSYGGNNVANAKKEIEDAIDVINEAFGRLFDSMFEEKAWDISSDIKTMKTMMANDGLADGEGLKI